MILGLYEGIIVLGFMVGLILGINDGIVLGANEDGTREGLYVNVFTKAEDNAMAIG